MPILLGTALANFLPCELIVSNGREILVIIFFLSLVLLYGLYSNTFFSVFLNLLLFCFAYLHYNLYDDSSLHELPKANRWLLKVMEQKSRQNSDALYCNIYSYLDSNNQWKPINREGVILSIKKTSTHYNNDYILAEFYPSKFEENLFKSQFDFSDYINNKGYYYQAYCKRFSVVKSIESFREKIFVFRTKSLEIIDQSKIKKASKGIVKAMLLGDKSHLNISQRENFASAGIMHVLAVSGLHLGIVYLLFNRVLIVFSFLPRYKQLKSLVLIVAIWTFALFSGFAVSVQRAAIMFTFFCLAELFNRKNKSANSISLAALILLLVEPKVLFDIGFLLSFSAVVSIVLVVPAIQIYLKRLPKLVRLLFDLFTVSIIAQLATLPLIIASFHQFPTWFLLFNALIIPLCFIVVLLSIFMILLVFLFDAFFGIDYLLNLILALMINIVNGVEALPLKIIADLYWSTASIFLLSAAVLFLFLFILQNKNRYFFLALSAIVLIVISESYELSKRKNQNWVLIHSENEAIYFLEAKGVHSKLTWIGKEDSYVLNQLKQESAFYYCNLLASYQITFDEKIIEVDDFLIALADTSYPPSELVDFWYCKASNCFNQFKPAINQVVLSQSIYCDQSKLNRIKAKYNISFNSKTILIERKWAI